MIKLEKILCAVDFSEYSLDALEYANHLALKENATLCLVHIVDSRVYGYGGPIYEPEPIAMQSQIDEDSVNLLKEKLLEKASDEIKDKVEVIVVFGVPFVEIIKAAKDHNIDLLVLGTHGRSGIAHMLIGSVAEKVVRKAPCPVLTVKSHIQ